MKYLRNALAGIILLGVLAVLLLWFLPARWMVPWIEPQLHGVRLLQVHGSLWDGGADEVTGSDGRRLGRAQWQLSRRAVLGQADLHLRFDGPQLTFSAAVRRLPDGRVEARAVKVDARLTPDRPLETPWGEPRGELQMTVAHALLQGGWPLELQGQGQWRSASMHTADGDVPLGDLQWRAEAQTGVVHLQWGDDGHGPLQVAGELQFSPLGWRLDTTMHARQTDPALQRWLAGLGPVAADGSVHIQRSGGLAGSTRSPTPDQDAAKP